MPDERGRSRPYFKSVLARRLIIFILLFSSIVTVLGTSLQLYLDFNDDRDQVNLVVDQIEASHVKSVTNGMWFADNALINVRLQEILSQPFIQYLEIKANGEIVARAGYQQSKNIIAREFPLNHPFQGQEIDLGRLYVEASLDGVYLRLKDRIYGDLLILGVEIFVVALFIFLLFYFLIGRNLQILADYTSNLDMDNLDQPLILKGTAASPPDELDMVASSINKMRTNLLLEIRKLKEAEGEIAKGRAEFAAIFNSITDALVFVDSKRRIVMINPAFTKTFGYQFAEVVGRTTEFFYLDHESYENQGLRRYNLNVSTEGTPVYEARYRRKDGTVFDSETMGVKVSDENGVTLGFLGIMRDVTEKKKFLAEKEGLEANIRQACKMEALGTMAGGIAHDFNNTLAIILGNSEMALDDIPSGHPSRYSIEQALEAARRAKELVRQILFFSRQQQQKSLPLRPGSLVRETMKLLRSTTPTTISIVENLENNCGSIMIDPTQFHQLVMNLFTNAVFAMDEKGPIEVSLRETELYDEDFYPEEKRAPGRYVMLTVTDSGIGMDRDTIERIFDPFYTTKGLGLGTGMGLSVVHGIVESCGAIIRVESAPGQGSSFRVYFPVVAAGQEKELSEQTEPLPTGTEKLLFVDDEEGLIVMGSRILTRLGYTVICESCSTVALEIFKADPDSFDLLITDQSMPDMSGTELIAEILKVRPELPVILCTGYSTKVSAENAKDYGADELIMKPYEKKILAETIRKVLDGF